MSVNGIERISFLGAPFDLESKDHVLGRLAERRPDDAFRYVVTPNVDHIARLARTPELLPIYQGAWMSWCDSHPVRRLARLVGYELAHMNGTDVMMRVFADVLRPGDRLAVIGASESLVSAIAERFPQFDLVAHVPPMGFVDNPQAFAAAADFAAHSGARFTFIGVGSPQSEQLAAAIGKRAGAKGTAFCIGAALEFISGKKARAPQWMQDRGLEWAFRLLSEPRRLWRRYLGGVLPLAVLFWRELRVRRR